MRCLGLASFVQEAAALRQGLKLQPVLVLGEKTSMTLTFFDETVLSPLSMGTNGYAVKSLGSSTAPLFLQISGQMPVAC